LIALRLKPTTCLGYIVASADNVSAIYCFDYFAK
jgi:hypothetical protein